MKVYQYYKDLPPWAKGVVVVGGAVVVYLFGSRVYRAVFPTEAQKKNRELEKNIDSEISKMQGREQKYPHYRTLDMQDTFPFSCAKEGI